LRKNQVQLSSTSSKPLWMSCLRKDIAVNKKRKYCSFLILLDLKLTCCAKILIAKKMINEQKIPSCFAYRRKKQFWEQLWKFELKSKHCIMLLIKFWPRHPIFTDLWLKLTLWEHFEVKKGWKITKINAFDRGDWCNN